jgi:hypothetical protein
MQVATLRPLTHARFWNIAVRTIHIAATGALFGGHCFGVDADQLRPWLYSVIASGAALAFLEAYPTFRWWHEVRAAMVLGKLLLLCSVPWFWAYRVPILVAVIALGSVGSHMPRRFRYYSLLERRGRE